MECDEHVECMRARGKKVETVHLPPRAGETYTQTFSLSPKKIENQLNFKPQWNIEQSIEQLINACT
jgi:nucleoside-diphosphate-sugar epimerase